MNVNVFIEENKNNINVKEIAEKCWKEFWIRKIVRKSIGKVFGSGGNLMICCRAVLHQNGAPPLHQSSAIP